MSGTRFDRPAAGHATPMRFPEVTRGTLGNGLTLWAIEHASVPVFTATVLLPNGTGGDPSARPGLASLTGDLIDEGAGDRDALTLSEAFAQMGTQIEVEVGPDACSISVTALSRFLGPALQLMSDVVMRPRLAEPDFNRVRDLRLSRLRQLSTSAGTMADRMFVSEIFGDHPYGPGALGTTRTLETITLDETRDFWRRAYSPRGATLIIVGAVAPDEASRMAADVFGTWTETGDAAAAGVVAETAADARIVLVDKPGAPQSELRIGHLGPPRLTPMYHALVALNAVLGGQFTSRINRRLREEKGVTYGARTTFDFRRMAGTFSCETSVQADATATAVSDVLEEFETVRRDTVSAGELASAQAALTRGYVRNFETAGQVARAAAQLAIYGLDDRTFDRFVPLIEGIDADDVREAATMHVRPEAAAVIVVGDASACGPALEQLGRPVVTGEPEF